jgi:hypothetical protein
LSLYRHAQLLPRQVSTPGLCRTNQVITDHHPARHRTRASQFYQVPFGYHRIDPIKDSLDDAGFSDLRIAVLSLNKLVPDVATYARALVLGNPLVDQIRARGRVDPERVIEALAEAPPREFGADPVRILLQAIVVEARRR